MVVVLKGASSKYGNEAFVPDKACEIALQSHRAKLTGPQFCDATNSDLGLSAGASPQSAGTASTASRILVFPSNVAESASTVLDIPEELRLALWRQDQGHSEADGLVVHEEVTVEWRVRVVSRIAPTTQLPAVRGLVSHVRHKPMCAAMSPSTCCLWKTLAVIHSRRYDWHSCE